MCTPQGVLDNNNNDKMIIVIRMIIMIMAIIITTIKMVTEIMILCGGRDKKRGLQNATGKGARFQRQGNQIPRHSSPQLRAPCWWRRYTNLHFIPHHGNHLRWKSFITLLLTSPDLSPTNRTKGGRASQRRQESMCLAALDAAMKTSRRVPKASYDVNIILAY